MPVGVHEAERDVVHEEAGGEEEGFVVGAEEGAGDEVDGLVDAVGEEDLVVGETVMASDESLDGGALGVGGEDLGGERRWMQARTRGDGSEGVFVEVQAEGVAAGERRVVLRHGEDFGARIGEDGGRLDGFGEGGGHRMLPFFGAVEIGGSHASR